MKSFAIAAFAGAASAAWAPPAYGGQESSAPVASSSAAQPAGYDSSSAPAPPAYGATTSSAPVAPTGYTKPASSSTMATYACNPAHAYPNGAQCISTAGTLSLVTPSKSAPAYGTGSAPAYGTGSAPAYTPKPTGGYGGSWGSGNETGGYGSDSYVTQVVTKLTTYCPGPTTLTQNSKTYTVTEATTLTIEDCPCTQEVPVQSYTPVTTTEVMTSFTTTCPKATTVTYGPSTYTVSSSTVLTVTDCPGGCTVTNEVPGTFVVPYTTTVCPSPSAPTTVTVGTQTYPVTDETTISVTAPTSYVTKTSVISKPAQPTSYVIESTTYPVSEATTITYTQPTQQGYTVTMPIASMPQYSAPPAASTPVAPVPAQPSAGYPAPSGYQAPSGYTPAGNGSSPVSPNIPEQTGNGAGKLMAGGAAFAAAVGAFFL